jgi:hypothetical protein
MRPGDTLWNSRVIETSSARRPRWALFHVLPVTARLPEASLLQHSARHHHAREQTGRLRYYFFSNIGRRPGVPDRD